MSQTRMVKTGPCNHCGIESTAEWRHGPDHKPTLCNACGMRWKIHHNFIDYTPKHGYAKGYGHEVTPKRKKHYRVGANIPKKAESRPKTQKRSDGLKGDAAKAGSEISSSDEYIRSESGQEDSGTAHPDLGNIPRRKRSKLDPVGTLQRKLKDLLWQPEFSHLQEEEDPLLIVPNNQMSSGEIGLGCELHKPPGSSNE